MVLISKQSIFVNSMVIVIFFTIAYYTANHIERRFKMTNEFTGKKIEALSLFDAFYFTLITQTTVGYGNIHPPSKITQVINILQLLTIYKVIELAIL